jgi:alanyl aminopeptidase
VLFALLLACGTPAQPSVRTEDRPREIPDVTPQAAEWDGWLEHDVVPLRYALHLRIVPASERFEGAARIRVRVGSPRRTIWLHGRGLEVTDAIVHAGRAIPARWTGQADDESRARIDLDEDVSGEIDLELRWRGRFTRYEGLSRIVDGDRSYVFSHLPPIAARTVFPCFDEPRFKTPFELVLRTPPGDGVFANAPIRTSREVDGLRETTFEPTEPLPTYLVALAVGPFDVLERTIPPNDVRDRPLSFRGVALAGERDELAAVMRETPGYLAAIER